MRVEGSRVCILTWKFSSYYSTYKHIASLVLLSLTIKIRNDFKIQIYPESSGYTHTEESIQVVFGLGCYCLHSIVYCNTIRSMWDQRRYKM